MPPPAPKRCRSSRASGSPVTAEARIWRCGQYALALDRPLVMGIVNITPDSFSDGGTFLDPVAALRHGHVLAAAGADLVDVGGESTRPGSDEVSASEELERVLPVVEALVLGLDIPVSIDTRHHAVARACVEVGGSVINDVSGFRDPGMIDVAAACDAGLVVMHMLGEPKNMQAEPCYDDVVAEVHSYLAAQADALESAGVAADRICVDPGIGFGKTTMHNLELLNRLPELVGLGYPLLVGASRKRFIGEVTGESEPARRIGGSVAAALTAVARGASVVRVHDVAETVQALRVWQAVGGETW
ncbi:MAG: dihydropteroate synthase [Coriobacteriia bacterium]|nr:dihydropteroate synthase [Coriobacteriia bacterium]